MYLSEICLKRPIGTYLIMLALLFFGSLGYYFLPISQLPEVYLPTIVVNAVIPGASPETMSRSVATHLEKRFANIAGVDSISSKSSLGNTQITLQFSLNKSIDAAALDVQAAINSSLGDLPSNMLYPPIYTRINPAEAPILYLAMYSEIAPKSLVNDYAERLFAQNLSMVNGVAQVSVYGAQKYATRIQLDPNKLSSYQLSLLDVKQSLIKANVSSPTGNLSTNTQEIPIKLNSEIEDVTQYENLIVAYRNGGPIKLDQLGKVVASVENNKVGSWFNDQGSIILAIQRQPGSNTLDVINNIYKKLHILTKQLPASINIVTMYDRSPTIKFAVHDVQFSLIIACVLVVMIIFVFLRNIRSAIIVGLVLPLSIIGTFAFMYHLNFSLNIVSLLALTLVVGFVVDDAIVVLENITRHIEAGTDPEIAAVIGSKEIGFTILTITLSLIVVFVPILFMGGIVGKFFHEFAVTSVITIAISGFISLSLTPVLAGQMLQQHNIAQTDHKWFRLIEQWYHKIFDCYQVSLNWVLSHKSIMVYCFIGTIMISLTLFKVIHKSFIPEQDLGNFICFTEADPDISFRLMQQKQQQISNIIRSDPDVASVVYNVGAMGLTQTMNTGFIIVKLKDYADRVRSVKTIINELRPKVNTVPGIKVYLQNIQVIPIGGRMNQGNYQYTILDPDLKKLQEAVAILQQSFEQLPEIQDVSNDLQKVTPQLAVTVDREKAGFLGVNMQEIANTLYAAFGSGEISNFYQGSETYKVILEILPGAHTVKTLQDLEVKSSNGGLVPLNAFAKISVNQELLTINHQGQVPAATISFNLTPGKSLSSALNAIDATVKKLNLPDSVVMQFVGVAETFKSSIKNLLILLFIVGIVIYILLGVLYENLVHPITVLSGLPAAFVGALLFLIIFRIDLDLYGFIGLVILMGIVKKNAIMMIDFALTEQRNNSNLTAEQAIYHACLIRFRPIMMTTMAALFGTLPIALGIGSVAIETQRSLGIAVVGGLVFSQILTLYITPVLYIYFSRLVKKA